MGESMVCGGTRPWRRVAPDSFGDDQLARSSPAPFGRWLVVGFGFLALALAFSARATVGLVMPIWDRELGWSRSFVSGAAAVALLVMAMVAPFAGRMIDRHGVRMTLAVGLALTGIGSLAVGMTSSPVVFL